MAEVLLENVSKIYGNKVKTINQINLRIPANQLTVFVGPSGCGKSTLLKLIAGLEESSSGSIHIDSKDVTFEAPAKRGIAMVFQSYALYPHMTVYENMAFALKIAKADAGIIDQKVRKVAGILKLDTLLDRKPRQLSGGQRQRVAIGRALVREPKVFLLDEPLSNLDAALRVDMRIEIAKIRESLGATMIYVTHDQVEAMTLADNIVVLRAGVVEQMGAPLEIYHKPVNKFVAGFLGSPAMNFIEASAIESSADKVTIQVADSQGTSNRTVELKLSKADQVKKGDVLSFGIRPEHIKVGSGPSAQAFLPEVVERLGDHSLVYGKLGNSSCTLKLGPDFSFEKGKMIDVQFDLDHSHLFDSNGTNLRV